MILKNLIKGILCVAVGMMLLICREEASYGIKQGVNICLDVLVPSLFPFMILSSFAVKYGIFSGGEGKCARLFTKITGLPFSVFPAIFFGFTGGYPVGMSVAAELYENGVIDRKTALRLSSFCVNAGPAFIITAVGTMIFGSSEAGFKLFFCVSTASVITGIIISFFIKSEETYSVRNPCKQSFSDVFTGAVESSCKKMFVMCGWVLLFSCFSGIIGKYGRGQLSALWGVFGEVTAGVRSAEKTGGLPLTAACISSGGLCVMCQLLPSMKKCGAGLREYLTFRILNSVISYVLMKIILIISPVSVETFSYECIPLGTGNVLSSVLLLVTSVVFVADMSSERGRKLRFDDLF
ncbi:MAG: hypothetical protein IKW03_08755 [Clostridia bacterium]|nr:hypothetical protein [Clostridia bacterium]